MKEGDRVVEGQILIKLDTEASEENRNSLEKAVKLRGTIITKAGRKTEQYSGQPRTDSYAREQFRTKFKNTESLWSTERSGCVFRSSVPKTEKHRC